jgi:hypothetical protein
VIRPFDLRDIPLVRELEDKGAPLFTEAAVTGRTAPLRGAITAYFALGARGTPTFILRDREEGQHQHAFAQLRHIPGAEHARVSYIAPKPTATEIATTGWAALIERLIEAAGERGAQSLVAEAHEGGEEVTWLRNAGFAVYARQDVWRLVGARPATPAYQSDGLRPRRSDDTWGVHLLYANTAPRLLQLAEPPPGEHTNGWRRGYVMQDKNEIIAYVELRHGPRGVWVKALLHPEADERAHELIASALALSADRPSHIPVYWGVRRYQDWLRGPLADFGFAPWSSQAVMLKQIAARVEQPEFGLLPALEKRPEITTPFTNPIQQWTLDDRRQMTAIDPSSAVRRPSSIE